MSSNNGSSDRKEQLCINTIRTLSIDAIEKANCGHPGAPMALAPAAYALWTQVMRYNPKNPSWFNRDRFVLSNGHASMLLYSMLYLTGFDLTLDDIKQFRQWGSRTPGHPEAGHTAGVETTTGPLGQGMMNAVGMAMAEAHLAAIYNRHSLNIVDHYTYVFCGDGDLMEGASHEAASLAGHMGLGKLICLYDDNHISIEGETEITYTENARQRFESYNWHVIDLGEAANDVGTIADAFKTARSVTDRPSMVILRTHIGFGAPTKQDTPGVHGSPLGEQETKATKENYKWPTDKPFHVPEEALNHMRQAVNKGQEAEQNWQSQFQAYQKEFPELAERFQQALQGTLPSGWHECLPVFDRSHKPIATRAASGKAINAFAESVHWTQGGSADLAPSTKTLIDGTDYFARGSYAGRNIAYGVREHAMCAAASGLALHGGIRPFVATFFVFTDYARPAIRLAALMKLPVIYVMTHDSIGLGEDGPTHQPVEHLASFRIMPNIHIIRPADANETMHAWRAALERLDGPTILVLSRQSLPVLDQQRYGAANGLLKGAYILAKERGSQPDIILIATGSEVHATVEARQKLADKNIDARVVSMPCWELFRAQSQAYRDEVLPPAVTKRMAIEAGVTGSWHTWVGAEGAVIAVDTFGASAPTNTMLAKYGFSPDAIVERASALL